jgi:hypothetical protein
MKFQVKISQEKLGVDEQTGGEGARAPRRLGDQRTKSKFRLGQGTLG